MDPDKRKMRKPLFILVGILAIGLSFPISNLFIKRTYVASTEDPEFKTVSDILVRKCADCHTKDLGQYPMYFNFPIASYLEQRNIKNGQASFLMSRDKLSGKVPFTASEIARLSQAMVKGNMPPLQYLSLHWDAALNEAEQSALIIWIHKRAKEYDIRAIPVENFFHPEPTKAALGKLLFHDKRLSGDNSISCASCHSLDKGGADHLKFSTGVNGQVTSVNTPTVLNAAYNFAQYWDGHVANLKAQAMSAVTNPMEMASNWGVVIERLQKDSKFSAEFKAAYPDGINADNISSAIAEYENTLLTPGSRFDKYLAGDSSALSDEEKTGLAIFKKHECFTCHTSPALGGVTYEKLGITNDYFKLRGGRLTSADNGRFNVTRYAGDIHRFKVPTLRNVELTAPYFHDGSASTLEQAVKVMSECQVEKPISDDECKKVAAFLKSLTGTLDGKSLSLQAKP